MQMFLTQKFRKPFRPLFFDIFSKKKKRESSKIKPLSPEVKKIPKYKFRKLTVPFFLTKHEIFKKLKKKIPIVVGQNDVYALVFLVGLPPPRVTA